MSTPTSAPPRTLADELRARDDVALAALFAARPDLAHPVPTDMTNLVARANTRSSVGRAVELLDRFTLQVLDGVLVLPDPTDAAAVARMVPAGEGPVRTALAALRERALVWGPDDALRVVRTVREVVPNPGGTAGPLGAAMSLYSPGRLQAMLADLGLPSTPDPVTAVAALARLLGDPASVAEILAGGPPEVRELLAVMESSGGAGQVERADRDVRVDTARTPIEWLLARGMLVALGAGTVVLPREVAVALRGGVLHPEPAVAPPPPAEVPTPGAAAVDRSAAGQASLVTRQVEDLLDAWSLDPPAVLRTGGGLGVRDMKRTATALDLDPHLAALVLEAAYAAGLVAADGEEPGSYMPTPEFDRWRELPTGERWVRLAQAWLAATRVPALVGVRAADYPGGREKPIAALSREVDRGGAAEIRRAALQELAALPAGKATTLESVLARLEWRRPLRGGRLRELIVPATLAEAAHLGFTAHGAVSAFGRALLADDVPGTAAKLEALLPEPLDHVLLQADLTAVAPGPLARGLGAELALAADVESKGGATVYRFSAASVRRALDAGRTAGELHELFRRVSRTPVPQPLTYLVDDVARRHGRLRVGAAMAYLRCDDESVLAELAADRRAAALGMRRLAPTVAIADTAPDALVSRLRELGYAPAAESARGEVVIRRPDARRTGARAVPRPVLYERPVPNPTVRAAAVRALRAGDRAATIGARRAEEAGAPGLGEPSPLPGPAERPPVGELVSTLRAAAAAGRSMWLGYVDNDGTVTERVVDPILVEGGTLVAFDHRQARTRNFSLSRITAVADA